MTFAARTRRSTLRLAALASAAAVTSPWVAKARHDVDAAERAMRQHLDEVSRFYWQARGQ